jgi:tRNA A-37 threonylcarbamoyl transferase component Bud32
MTGKTDQLGVKHIRGVSQDDLFAIIAAHHSALHSGEGILKNGYRNVVTRVRHRDDWFCVKEYLSQGLFDRIKDLFRGLRARQAWRGASHLRRHGIAAPEALALVEQAGKSYLVTRFIKGGVPLNLLLRERFSGPLARDEIAAKRAMVQQLGQWLRRIHNLGVYHDDWSTKNILATEQGGQWAFHILDTESVSPRKRLTYRRRVKNLGQLSDAPFGIMRTDRMLFLLAYAGGDASLTRGSFPHDVLAAARRRTEKWARVQSKAFKRKARLKRKMENEK